VSESHWERSDFKMYAVPSKQHYAKEREGSSAQTLRAQGLVHFQGFCSRAVFYRPLYSKHLDLQSGQKTSLF